MKYIVMNKYRVLSLGCSTNIDHRLAIVEKINHSDSKLIMFLLAELRKMVGDLDLTHKESAIAWLHPVSLGFTEKSIN